MSGKKDKPIDLSKVTPDEKMKYEIAEELGLLDQVTGRIGGLITKKRREASNNHRNVN